MVERKVGQMSLADSLVRKSRSSILDEVGAVVDWAPLRSLLGKRGGDGAGNSSYPAEVLLRCLLAGIWHNLSDPALEAAIADRLSFRRFVGLSLHDRTPDHTTLWRFRQELAKDGLIEKIFEEINRQFEAKHLILKQGTLVDASLIPARARPPRKASKEREETPPKPSVDPDAKWGKKGKKSVYGYKIHTGVDAGHTIIRRIHMTDASVTDTKPADRLFCGDEKAVYGDQAYYTHRRHARLKKTGIKDRLMHRANKHHALTARQKQLNKLIAKVRAEVERPYAVLKEQYGLRRMRFFNYTRNKVQVVLACCAYNLRRVAGILSSPRERHACG
ncbi:transposase [Bradyrhizobium sp. ORS 285]|uniref:IS5 family transposase n=1 Tax=Bradyrhizobium sp. ORS 285 TaxID=115808 RepID=UPI000B41E6BA|nr:IS5 family transposase [Bradyrhizobium sp. ORS 285]SMX57255.1 transposase [Bradyrhizobium sp. ORS 285]